MKPNQSIIERALEQRRSLEGVLANLRTRYAQYKSSELAELIQRLEAEIEARNQVADVPPCIGFD